MNFIPFQLWWLFDCKLCSDPSREPGEGNIGRSVGDEGTANRYSTSKVVRDCCDFLSHISLSLGVPVGLGYSFLSKGTWILNVAPNFK